MNNYKELDIKFIIPDKDQPRKIFNENKLEELAMSIKEKGILNPIVVEKKGDKYLIIDGERRYKCAKKLGLNKVVVNIVESNKSLLERNILRFHYQETQEQWDVYEKAQAIGELKDSFKMNTSELAHALGMTTSTVDRYLLIYKVPDKDLTEMKKLDIKPSMAMSLSALKRSMPIQVSSKCKNFFEILIDKVKNETITSYKEIKYLNDLIRNREYEYLIEFFEDRDATIQEIIYQSEFLKNRNLNNVVKKIKLVTDLILETGANKDNDYNQALHNLLTAINNTIAE